jgi:cation/acetate symporter
MFDLPYVSTALIYVGALATTIAAANAIAFTMASSAGHDFYGGVIDTRASAGRQLIVTRTIMVGLILAAAWAAANRADDAFTLAFIAISLSAGGLFPAVVLAVWWKRSNAAGALSGIVVGTLVTAAVIFQYRYPGVFYIAPLDPELLGLNELTASLAGIPAGLIAAIIGSVATAAPTPADLAVADAIRRPGGTPFIQEIESR